MPSLHGASQKEVQGQLYLMIVVRSDIGIVHMIFCYWNLKPNPTLPTDSAGSSFLLILRSL